MKYQCPYRREETFMCGALMERLLRLIKSLVNRLIAFKIRREQRKQFITHILMNKFGLEKMHLIHHIGNEE